MVAHRNRPCRQNEENQSEKRIVVTVLNNHEFFKNVFYQALKLKHLTTIDSLKIVVMNTP